MEKAKITLKLEDGTTEEMDIQFDKDTGEVKAEGEVSTLGSSLGCLLGLHAWRNGVCVVCGKKQ